MSASQPGVGSAIWLKRLAVTLVAVAAYVLWPMATVLLVSGFVVVVAQRPYQWLLRRFQGHRKLSAFTATVVLTVLFFTPVLAATYVATVEAADALRKLVDEFGARGGGWEAIVKELPPTVRSWAEAVRVPVAEAASGAGRTLLSAAARLLPSLGWWVAEVFLVLVTVYYLFAKGPAVVVTLKQLLPIAPASSAALFAEFREVAQGLFGGGLLTLLFHGSAAALGYWIFGVPRVALLALLSALSSLIPLIGASLVWAPVAIQLAVSGHPSRGIGLAVWGLLVVGAGEYALRPWVSKGHMALPRFLLFLMFFGGMQVWGAKGLLLGPLVGSLAITAVRLVHRTDSPNRAADG